MIFSRKKTTLRIASYNHKQIYTMSRLRKLIEQVMIIIYDLTHACQVFRHFTFLRQNA